MITSRIENGINFAKIEIDNFNMLIEEYKICVRTNIFPITLLDRINEQKKINNNILRRLRQYVAIYDIPDYLVSDLHNCIHELNRYVYWYPSGLLSSRQYKPVNCTLCRQNNDKGHIIIDIDNTTKCPICISDYSETPDMRWCELYSCKHKYHVDCLLQYTNHKDIHFLIEDRVDILHNDSSIPDSWEDSV